MTTTATHERARMFLHLAVPLAVLVLVGAAFILRGPEPPSQPLPEMAKAPVILPDGGLLYVQKHEVTVAEWNRCHVAGGCALALSLRAGWDPETTPATGLSYVDVSEYLDWIIRTTGHNFRLPFAWEWNHMARFVLPEIPEPIFKDPELTWASAYLTEGLAPRALKAQGSFSTSPEGVVDLDGSVWEWTQECYSGGTDAVDPSRCPAFFVGGEHSAVIPYLVRDPARGGCAVGTPPAHLGMRLVAEHAF